MSCVICGKKDEIMRVSSVRYSTQTTLPEVLAAVIGSKLASEDWNDGSQHICRPCERRCEEYDKLDVKLQELKDTILQEYSRRLYLEASEEAPPFKKIRLRVQDPAEADAEGEVAGEGDGADEGGADRGDEEGSEKGDEGVGEKEKGDKGGEKGDIEGEGDEGKRRKGEKKAGKGAKEDGKKKMTTVDTDLSVKTETADECSQSSQRDDDPTAVERTSTPNASAKKTADASEYATVTRVTEKSNIRQLPDYEYEQWFSLDGYCYVQRSHSARGQLLECHRSDCSVTVRVSEGPLARITGAHTHEPDRRIPERNKLYDKLKKRSMEDSTTSLETIYEEEAKRFPGGASCMPFPEVRMREWRAAKDPTVTIHTDVNTLEEINKKYQCDVCNMGFNSSRLLTRHSRQHERSASPEVEAPRRPVGRPPRSASPEFEAPRRPVGRPPRSASPEVEAPRRPVGRPPRASLGAGVKKMKMGSSTPVAAIDRKLKKTLDKKVKRVLQKLQGVAVKTSPGKSEVEDIVDDWEDESSEPHACHVCKAELPTIPELKQHIVDTHSDVLMCVHCDIAFDTPRLLKRHTTFCRKCCDERKLNKSKMAEEAANANDDDDDDDYLERELGRITGDDAGAILDSDNDPGWDDSQEPEEDDDDWDIEGGGNEMPKPKKVNSLKCEVCPMDFPRFQQLRQHLYTHSSVKQFECPCCGETFGKKATCVRHMAMENHEGSIKINPPRIDRDEWSATSGIKFEWGPVVRTHRYYECAICSDTFNSERSLFKHMKERNHKSDEMIVHERTPSEEMSAPPAPSPGPRRAPPAARPDPADEVPVVVGGLKFKSRRQAMEAWLRSSGKKAVECAVCGAGFDARAQLLAHMEKEEHLTDSIIENIPVLDELSEYYVKPHQDENQIVPTQVEDQDLERIIKQEVGKVEIMSQVIISQEDESHKQEAKEEETEQTYYIQTENVDGETVMVIQGDLDGSLHENMQLFMDEEGNIVTHDEDGNTVKVMQVDLSKVQHAQEQGEQNSDKLIELEISGHHLLEHEEEETNMQLLEEIEEENDSKPDLKDILQEQEQSKAGLLLEAAEQDMEDDIDNTEGTEDSLEGREDNMEDTENNMEVAEDNMEGAEDNMEGAEDNMEGEEDNMEGAEDNIEGTENDMESAEYNMEGAEDNMEGAEDNMEGAEDNMEGAEDNMEGAEDNMEDVEDNIEGAENNIEGTENNMKGAEDNMEGAEDNTEDNMDETVEGTADNMEGALDNVQEGDESIEETAKNLQGSVGNVKDIEDNVEGTVKEDDAEEGRTIMTITREEASEDIEGVEYDAVAIPDEMTVEEKAEKEIVKVKKEEKKRKELPTPRKSSRNLEKSGKSPHTSEDKVDVTITSRLRRAKVVQK